jgi:class 3 adenylate cyclase
MKPLADFAALVSELPENTPEEMVSFVARSENNHVDRALAKSQEGHLLAHHRINTLSARKQWFSSPAIPTRRLAAILCADAIGYSRLMQDDDHHTLQILKRYRACISKICLVHSGRVVNTPGDSILVEFSSAVEAFAAAIEIQDSIKCGNGQLELQRRMYFRIGLDLGDILVDSDGSVYGNGVNIAARMQALAGHGGIVMSGKVFDEVSARLQYRFHALGRRRVKNIRDRVRAYEVKSPAVAKVARCDAAAGPMALLRGLLIAAADYLFPSAGPMGVHGALASLPEYCVTQDMP